MPMRAENARDLSSGPGGPVKVPGNVKPGQTLETHLLDRVIASVDLPVNDRVQRSLGRRRPQSERHQQLPAHTLGAFRPGLRSRRGGERKVTVQILEILEPDVVWQFTGRQRSGRLCRSSPGDTEGDSGGQPWFEREPMSAGHKASGHRKDCKASETRRQAWKRVYRDSPKISPHGVPAGATSHRGSSSVLSNSLGDRWLFWPARAFLQPQYVRVIGGRDVQGDQPAGLHCRSRA